MSEKLEKMRIAFSKANVSANDFSMAAKINGMSNADYAESIFDIAEVNCIGDDDLPELIENEVRQAIEKEAGERDAWLAKSGLSKRQRIRIRKMPLSAWRDGHYDKRKVKNTPFRLINHRLVNLYLSTKAETVEDEGIRMSVFSGLTFGDWVIYSALCSAFTKRQGVLSFSDIYNIVSPGARWSNIDGEAFRKSVIDSIDRLHQVGIEVEDEEGGDVASTLIDVDVIGDEIHVGKSVLWEYSDQAAVKRVITIDKAFLSSGRCCIDWLARIYVAKRIKDSSSPSTKVKAAIDSNRMAADLGYAVSMPVIAGYLNYLANLGVLSDVKVTGSVISWTPVFKASKRAENSVTSVVKTTVKDSDGKPMKDAQGRKIKQVIDVPKTAEAKRRDEAIAAYNEYIERQDIMLDGRKLDCSVKAEYMDDYEHAGRLYTKGNGHQVKGRENIRINGEATVEVDFATYHTQMIYDMEGIELIGDAYDFLPDRDHAKRTLNILFNASTDKEAKGAIKAACGVDYDKAEEYIAKAKQRHAPIASHFGKGEGLTLQNKDAAIMLDILAKLMAKRIPALPVHDSVIVPINAEAKAIEAMMDAYREAVGGDARIKSEGVEMQVYDARELRAYK